MLKIAICDDDRRICGQLEDLIDQNQLVDQTIDCFYTGDDLLRYLETNNECFNLFFLLWRNCQQNGSDNSPELIGQSAGMW